MYSNSFGLAASTRRLGRMTRPEEDKALGLFKYKVIQQNITYL